MKVKDLIAKLQTLDQEKDIHLIYDGYADVPFDIQIDEDGDFVRKGDYVINAG